MSDLSHIPTSADTDARIWITGGGLVTPLGSSADETWTALLHGRHIMRHSPLLANQKDRVTALAESAARQATAAAGWNLTGLDSHDRSRTALILATSKGAITAWLADDFPQTDSADLVANGYGLASMASEVAGRLGLNGGPRLTLSAACASGLHAVIRAAMMLRAGEIDRALVVAAEASVHPLFVGSFQRLGVLPPEGAVCRPFDRERRGFLMCDAAAAICLEKSRGASKGFMPVSVEAMAMAGDAMHLTSGDPQARLMTALLRRLAAQRPINLYHAHATGTAQHDPAELAAIDACAADADQIHDACERPLVYSHKGALGHSLGAAGLVGLVISCYCHASGIVPPNVNTHLPLAAKHVGISSSLERRPVKRSITFATGFGGPMAGIVLNSEPAQLGTQPGHRA